MIRPGVFLLIICFSAATADRAQCDDFGQVRNTRSTSPPSIDTGVTKTPDWIPPRWLAQHVAQAKAMQQASTPAQSSTPRPLRFALRPSDSDDLLGDDLLGDDLLGDDLLSDDLLGADLLSDDLLTPSPSDKDPLAFGDEDLLGGANGSDPLANLGSAEPIKAKPPAKPDPHEALWTENCYPSAG